MINIREEQLGEHFTKFHLEGPWPFDAVIHRFTESDRGNPHDHPWGFRSFILKGGYVERVYFVDRSTGKFVGREDRDRRPGDSFAVEARHIHRIVELPESECWTLILPGPMERVSRFYEFRGDEVFSRLWSETEYQPHLAD